MMNKLFILLFFICLGVSNTKAQLQETDIMMKLLELKTGLLMKDSTMLSQILADDVTYGHSNGLVETKSQLIRSVMSGHQDYKIIEPSDTKLRFYGNTAIVNMKAHINLIYEGSPLDLNMMIVLVWVKKGKTWQLVARQSASLKL